MLCRYDITVIRRIELTCFASSALRGSLLPIALCFSGLVANAQQPVAKPQSPVSQSSDVVRINTELVQTDLMVFDKTGPLVDGLLPEQFEITVDGMIVTFKQLLTVVSNPAQDQVLPVMWNQQLRLAPGLYQVRVAVRERNTGRTGSAQQWIQVPDLSRASLQMSSLFVAERKAPSTEQATGPGSLPVNINLRFARSSVLRYQTYIYNVANGIAPDIEIQARVLQDGKTLITMPARKLPTDSMKDHASMPYWAELSLSALAPGHYRLELTATARTTKSSAIQTLRFVVE